MGPPITFEWYMILLIVSDDDSAKSNLNDISLSELYELLTESPQLITKSIPFVSTTTTLRSICRLKNSK